MSDAVKKFSFLNRWFVFRKRKEVVLKEEAEESDYVPIVNSSKKKTVVVAEAGPIEPEPPTAINRVIEKADSSVPIVKEATVAPEEVHEERIVNAVKKEKESITEAQTVQRTVPVEKGTAAAVDKLYSSNEVINFYIDASLDDKKLRINDKGAARWLAPSSPFPIEDPEDSSIEYPSIDHFMAAMMYEYGSTNPTIAQTVFSRTGTIHQSFVRKRLLDTQAQKKAISEERDFELIKEESAEVKLNIGAAAFKKYKTVFNESKFAVKKDELLEYAVDYRFKKDKRLRKILEAARENSKYLLFYTKSTVNNLGGMRSSDGRIIGDNKLGKLYMKVAGYSTY
jgi:predicted NAD-dependent protein-ADP-ribosyltransferase YbiA (DUF1768 family)